ncbi:MAG: CehA/McbA family metallohydrolase [Deltaproteobacteria bacterium]|nr:CehA/McbA family metallohydrolase [Deltaproteobacteria bacterium]
MDGDGDGERSFLVDSPGVDVAAGPPAQLVVTGPTIARPGETVRIHLAVLDATGSAGTGFTGRVIFERESDGLELPDAVEFSAADAGIRTIEVVARTPGVHRLRARASDDLVATSNPIVVSEIGPRVLWGDIHGHSKLSDGTGTVADYFRYARDVAGLDVAALTDHDHWGILPLDEHPEMWREIREGTQRVHEPGRFVSLLAWEWTSWIHGHRHVVYFEDAGEVYSSLSTEYETPQQLWAALAGQPALTFAHHSAGGPIPTNWDIPPDPVLEPITEITSVHGSSEAPDSPFPIYNPVNGNFVRDVLERGYRLGFIGSGDGHDGHPGLAQLASGFGGMAAILSEERTRESVLAAFRERRVYATNGPRILLRTAFGSYGMGMTVPVPDPDADGPRDELFVHVVAVTPLERIDIIRSGKPVRSIAAEGRLELAVQVALDDLHSGEFVYVRAVQEDQGAAWSSPIFFD